MNIQAVEYKSCNIKVWKMHSKKNQYQYTVYHGQRGFEGFMQETSAKKVIQHLKWNIDNVKSYKEHLKLEEV